jgi:hypothetical protein
MLLSNNGNYVALIFEKQPLCLCFLKKVENLAQKIEWTMI